MVLLLVIKLITEPLKGICYTNRSVKYLFISLFSIVSQPGLDQPSIILRDPNQRNYLIGGLKPNTKYRVQVRARTIAGLSTSPAMIELTTNVSLGKYEFVDKEPH